VAVELVVHHSALVEAQELQTLVAVQVVMIILAVQV
jgi:hypothetical protein